MREFVIACVVLVLLGGCSDTGKSFSVHQDNNGWWWAHIEGHAYPFGAWRMDRGPYPFRWMAELEFPIERLTRDGPRR